MQVISPILLPHLQALGMFIRVLETIKCKIPRILNYCSKICFYMSNFRLIWFQVMNIALEVLQACIYLVETCQGGTWGPLVNNVTKMLHF